ncbi:MAG: hypothetical protein ISR65_20785 [Bacteriovoracaceae bacterium]|nr:hypothetical protein [Bacteriovoracaceae bacterium]
MIFTSDNDSELARKNIKTLVDTFEKVRIDNFPNHGHFIPEHMGTEAFPELLQELLKDEPS